MINKRELIASIAQQTGYTKTAVRNMLNTFIETVFEEVKSDGKVRIGGLGVFSLIHQGTRPVRNPQTQEPIMLVPRDSMKFRAADDLIRRLNGENPEK